jgi:hypothetical protein
MQGDLRRLSSQARSVPRHRGAYCHIIENGHLIEEAGR